jgi:hypothetical protein
MTNIWADIYKDIREPFFEIEDPYVMSEEKKEKKEKKEKEDKESKNEKEDKEDKPKRWWDDDGDGVGYEKGEVEGKFKKKVKEEVEQIDEISAGLAGRVVNARIERTGAAADRENRARTPQNVRDTVAAADKEARARKLAAGVRARRAANEEYMDEAQGARNNPEKYERDQDKKYAPVRGEKRPMPPRGHKDREAFERWYRDSLREERELHSKSDKNEKIDVRKGIKNKVDINPREELEAWIQELIAEGYDLSQFTLGEIADIYESAEVLDEVNSSTMPASGDAETVKADPLQSAKRRAAQAQVRKELSDLQVAKARATAKLTPASEAVINFVGTRRDLFEARFDPKKSRLRPASERTQNAMTDAQRKAAKKEAERTAEIHSKGETVLVGLRPQGKKGKVQTTPSPKPAAPEANRRVKGREDKLAAAADKVLKGLKK